MDEQQPPATFFQAPILTMPASRRTLGPHNSPVKSMSQNSSAHTSPRVTPTKGANPYGDRFIPLRQSNHDWNARYCSIGNEVVVEEETGAFKKPQGKSCNRHLNLQNSLVMSASASSAASGAAAAAVNGPGPSGSSTSTSTSSTASSSSSSSVPAPTPTPTPVLSISDTSPATSFLDQSPVAPPSPTSFAYQFGGVTTVPAQHHGHHTTPTHSSPQDYYQGPSNSGSGSNSPTSTHSNSCLDDTRNSEAVMRALLRNEMLRDRIDDVKGQATQQPEEKLSTFSLAPIVAPLPQPPTLDTPHGVTTGMERNAYGGSQEALVFPTVEAGVNEVTRVGSVSPTVYEMMEPRLRGGSDSPIELPPSPAGSVCGGETPTKTPTMPLSPIVPKQSPCRGLFAYSAKTTPIKFVTQPTTPTSAQTSPFGGPFSVDSQRLLRTPRKPTRKVPKNPYKVLDAPELQDDFYLNLVDWSSQNQLSVGLASCVYLWSATTSQVIKLCDLSTSNDQDTVTSVQWCDKGDLLAVGTNRGITQIWDVTSQKKVRDLSGHTSRVGCLAWNADTICSGSRDRSILHRDIRCDDRDVRKLQQHRQEVCGLKWSPDKQLLASGGNDNQLLVWNLRRPEPIQTYNQHNAAVKALAWSPHHHGLLVSGGGTADRCLRFWNTLTAQPMQCVDTGSQVCNVAWSKHSSELVSTHGYSYNHVIIWKYPSLQPVTKLVGHQYRVLYLAMSPDGESIVTGAGDETLRFWHVFNKGNPPTITRSKLNLHSTLR
ncbi:unnamed protein product [Caenorhabditis sp. 36 PRJEB53466]|nr:unnamed protein product [Caenorhabditis sp. 36 PRJEB53466]